MTIDYHAIRDTLARLTHSTNEDLISHMFTGLLAGIALGVKDPKLARTIDHTLRTQWEATHTATALVDPSAPYGAGLMAEKLIGEFSKDAGKSN